MSHPQPVFTIKYFYLDNRLFLLLEYLHPTGLTFHKNTSPPRDRQFIFLLSEDAAFFRYFQDSISLNCFVSWSLSPRQPNISVLSDFLWYEMKSSNHRDEIFVESFIVGIMPGVINGTSLASKCKTGFLNQLPAIKIFSAEFHFKAASWYNLSNTHRYL